MPSTKVKLVSKIANRDENWHPKKPKTTKKSQITTRVMCAHARTDARTDGYRIEPNTFCNPARGARDWYRSCCPIKPRGQADGYIRDSYLGCALGLFLGPGTVFDEFHEI